MNPTYTRKQAALLAGAALALLALTACANDSTNTAAGGHGSSAPSASYGPPATGPHNAQDSNFVKDMLPHHSQAVEMADSSVVS